MGRCCRCSAVIYATSKVCRACNGNATPGALRSWEEVVEEMVKRGDARVTRQMVTQIADRAIDKLRIGLLKDPVVRDWVIERGLSLDPTPKKRRGAKPRHHDDTENRR